MGKMKDMKTIGRKKSTPNKKTRELLAQAAAGGELPLALILSIMRDPNQETAIRFDAAKAAAPYLHPRLAAVEHKQILPDLSGLTDQEREQLERLVVRIYPRNDG
jgi:hypothetical protein